MTKSESRAEANRVVAVNAVVAHDAAAEVCVPHVVGAARILRRRPVVVAKTERAAIIRTCYS